MAVNKNDSTKRLTTYPINLQSFLQTAVLIITLVSGVVYADRRITTLELEFRHQSEMLRESRDDLKKALGNQERMIMDLRQVNANQNQPRR
jgi:hypothetical protein